MIQKGRRKWLAPVLALTAGLVLSLTAPVKADTLWQNAPRQQTNVSPQTVDISEASDFKEYLKKEGDYKLVLTSDISDRVGKKGKFSLGSGETVDSYWITVGKGVKIIELAGYDINLSNDLGAAEGEFWMFQVPKDATLVVNDSEDDGVINYNGSLSESNSPYMVQRNLIEVDGGTLRVNGGYLSAGRSSKFYVASKAKSYYKQINGTAVEVKNGTAVFNGGHISGRGFRQHKKAGDERTVRNAALAVKEGTKDTEVIINDGEFLGEGCADCVQMCEADWENDNLTESYWNKVYVYGGFFNTYKQDLDIVATSSVSSAFGTSYGYIGVDKQSIRSSARVSEYDRGTVEEKDYKLDDFLNTHSRLTITPPKEVETAIYDNQAKRLLKKGTARTYEWDKHSELSFGMGVVKDMWFDYYDPWIEMTPLDYDEIKTLKRYVTFEISHFEKGKEKVIISYQSPDGNIDLSKLPQNDLDKLRYGEQYYLKVVGEVCWKNAREYTTRYDCPYEVIIEPTDPAVDLTANSGWTGENTKEGYQVTLKPSYTAANMKKLIENGRIDSYIATLTYISRGDDKEKTRIYSNTELEGSAGEITDKILITDLQDGETTLSISFTLMKNGYDVTGKGTSASGKVRKIPKIYATNLDGEPIGEMENGDGRVIIKPSSSSKYVRLCADTTKGDQFEWRIYGWDSNNSSMWSPVPKENVTVTETGTYYQIKVDTTHVSNEQYRLFWKKEQYSAGSNLYTVGYWDGTLTGELSAPSEYEVTPENYNKKIGIVAKLAGDGLTANGYRSFHISLSGYPEGAKPEKETLDSAKNVQGDEQEFDFRKFFGISGSNEKAKEIYNLPAGDYEISGYGVDNTTQKEVHFQPVKIHLTHKLQKLQISVSDNDVTDSYVFNGKVGGEICLQGNTIPKYAEVSGEESWTSSDPEVAQVDKYGVVTCKKTGTAVITRTVGDISSKTTVCVPLRQAEVEFALPSFGESIPAAGTPLKVPDGAEYTAALTWTNDGYPTTLDTFAGHVEYNPMITITPKEGVSFPVDAEFYESYKEEENRYLGDKYAFAVTVNGKTYQGTGVWDGKEIRRDGSKDPICNGVKDEDSYTLLLPAVPEIVDPADEYVSQIDVSLSVPENGDKKLAFDETDFLHQKNELNLKANKGLLCHDISVGLVKGNAHNDSVSDDEIDENFTEYEDGQTYRAKFYVIQDSTKTDRNGKYILEETVNAKADGWKTLVVRDSYNQHIIYVYFTVGQDAPTEEDKESVSENTVYTVTYDENGGSGLMEAEQLKKGESFVLPVNTITPPEGKEFAAWLVNGIEYQPGETIFPEGDLTVSVIWKVKESGQDPKPTPGPGVSDGGKTGSGGNEQPSGQVQIPKKGTVLSDKNASYLVTKAGSADGEVSYKAPGSLKGKSIKIPDAVTFNGITYKVTAIEAKAGKGCKNLTSVTIGKNVAKIGKNAFNGCKKLKKVNIKSALLTKKSVGGGAFKNIHPKAVVKVPKKQLASYKKFLPKKGLNKPTQKVK